MGAAARAAVLVSLLALLAAAPAAAQAGAMGDPDVAALQVGLRLAGLYDGPVDGIAGPGTEQAVRSLQRRAGVTVDGVAGPATLRRLGRYARHRPGDRPLAFGHRGFDVAALQFALAWHGFPSGSFDGRFGPRLERAVRRFQRFARLPVDGIAGPETLHALRSPPPRLRLALAAPLAAPVGDRFGPRGDRFHPGLDFPAAAGALVRAVRSGRVVFAGWSAGGYGNLVKVAHGRGVVSWYAHLSRVDVSVGGRVRAGTRVGLVGSTGHSTGPHLHLEVRVRGAAADPLPALR